LALATSAGLLWGCRGEKAAAPPIREPKGFVESDGLKIYYESEGDGPTIVLVHGWGSSLQGNWVETGWVEALRPIRRVVMLDVRGHGASDKPHEQAVYSYSKMSRDVLAVMDHLGIERADYLGYSMGSCIGASLLGDAPRRFNKMILGGIGDETAESLVALPKIVAGLRAEKAEDIDDPIGAGFRAYATRDERNDMEALAVSALQMWPEGYPLKLIGSGASSIQTPILIVNGSDDHPYIDTVPTMLAALPSARLEVIPDCDHLATVIDPRFKEAVLQFLNSGDGGRQEENHQDTKGTKTREEGS
jgi:pimeloyl-ACP methyl ester carboxylesterase